MHNRAHARPLRDAHYHGSPAVARWQQLRPPVSVGNSRAQSPSSSGHRGSNKHHKSPASGCHPRRGRLTHTYICMQLLCTYIYVWVPTYTAGHVCRPHPVWRAMKRIYLPSDARAPVMDVREAGSVPCHLSLVHLANHEGVSRYR